MDNCPCKNCVCIPVCKHKNVWDLIQDCVLIDEFLYDRKQVKTNPKWNERMTLISDIINPEWGALHEKMSM